VLDLTDRGKIVQDLDRAELSQSLGKAC
jgi:hypothetical protein